VVRVDEEHRRKVDISAFASLSRNCPYNGMEFSCWPEEVVR
jgi:dihydroorotase-like cyclic amidohydrolase